MYFAFKRSVKRAWVEYFKRIFKTYNTFYNADIETITLRDKKHDIRPLVVENYRYTGEEYPAIVVSAGGGGDIDSLDFREYIGTAHQEYNMGDSLNSYVEVGGSEETTQVSRIYLDTALTPVQSCEIYLSYASGNTSDITVSFLADNDGEPSDTVLASGSIAGFSNTQPVSKIPVLSNDVNLAEKTVYWLKVQTEADSVYNLFTDEVDDTVRMTQVSGGSWTATNNETIWYKLYGDYNEKFGTDANVPITIQIAAKDAPVMERLFDICLTYASLVKTDTTGQFLAHGIKVNRITFAGDQPPREKGNDKIFIGQINIECRAGWTEEFSKNLLKEIRLDSVTAY